MFYNKEILREKWRDMFRNNRNDIEFQQKLFAKMTGWASTPSDFEIAEQMRDEMVETARRMVTDAKSVCPIGFWEPSWEQAQVLNAWSPEFEADVAPNGYRSVCNFSANRIGKTCASIINVLLWIITGNPDWVMFEERLDPHGRGKFRVLRRPLWEYWIRTGRMEYSDKEPPMGPCEVWHGVENDFHWKDKVGKEYLKWMPKACLGRRTDGGTAIYVAERKIVTCWGHTITGKTYNADVQDWSGKAVRMITMDEGFEKDKFDEATLRVEANGYFSWAYTPAEARNIGRRAALAHACYKGKHRLVGQAKFFIDFKMKDAPEHIIPAEKKADDLQRLKSEGAMGRVRSQGGFFESSPTVFNNFERERCLLPIDGSDALLAIKGNLPEKWERELGRQRAERLAGALALANIIRGMDEGLAAPSACVWTAVLRGGEYLTFREWEQSGLSIGERCEAIIDRSGNDRLLIRWDEDDARRVYRETPKAMTIRKTFADSKMFKRNPEHLQDDMTDSYRKQGLALTRASNIGPGQRCDQTNDLFRADPSRKHLLNADAPGCRQYVTRDCPHLIERLENYLWQQIAQGARAGEYTDQPEAKDDHTIDAFCYCGVSKIRWAEAGVTVTAKPHLRTDRQTGYIQRV